MPTIYLTANPPLELAPQPPGGGRADFWTLLDDESLWPSLAGSISGIKLYQNTIYHVTNDNLRRLFTWLNKYDIPLMVEAGVLPVPIPNGPGSGVEGFNGSFVPLMDKIRSLGGNVAVLCMDEPFYHATQWAGPNAPYYTTEQVIKALKPNLTEFLNIFPNAKIVDIEPFPLTKRLAEWITGYEKAMGRPLDGMQLDILWGQPWQVSMDEVLSILSNNGVPATLIVNSTPANRTDLSWTDAALMNFIAAVDNGRRLFESFMVQTWMPNPAKLFPATTPGTLASLAIEIELYDIVQTAYQKNIGRAPNYAEAFAHIKALQMGFLDTTTLAANLAKYQYGIMGGFAYSPDGSQIGQIATAVRTMNLSPAVANYYTAYNLSNIETFVAGVETTEISANSVTIASTVIGYSKSKTRMSVTGTGSSKLSSLTDNVTITVGSPMSLTLNGAKDIAVEVAGQGRTTIIIGNSLQQITLKSDANRIVVPQNVGIPSTLQSGTTSDNLIQVTGARLVKWPSALSGISQVEFRFAGNSGEGSWVIPALQANVIISLAIKERSDGDKSKMDQVILTGRGQAFYAPMGHMVSIAADSLGARAKIVGGGRDVTKMSVRPNSTDRIVLDEMTDNLTIQMLTPGSLELNNRSNITVLGAPGKGNFFWLKNASQSIYQAAGNNFVYMKSSAIGATVVGGDGYSQINVYDGGSAIMSPSIRNIDVVYLYSDSNTPKWNFVANDIAYLTIARMSVQYGLSGGLAGRSDEITLRNSTQSLNVGAGGTVDVYFKNGSYGANVVGNVNTKTTLHVNRGDSVMLGQITNFATVKIEQSNIVTNDMEFITIDASSGSNTVSVANRQDVLTGKANVIIDRQGGVGPGIEILGKVASFSGNTIRGFDMKDVIYLETPDLRGFWHQYVGTDSIGKLTVGVGSTSAEIDLYGRGLSRGFDVTDVGDYLKLTIRAMGWSNMTGSIPTL